MEWLTRELTPIEKVRRNVILLAALAFLASFFVIETDQMTFLGAKFSSDVIMFGIFHALAFYTGVLGMRAYFHERLVREAADADNYERAQRLRLAEQELAQAQEVINTPLNVDPVSQMAVEDAPTARGADSEARAVAARVSWEIKYLREENNFRQQGRWFIVFGEFVFPLIFGAGALVLLWNSQDIPMLWELHLRTE